MVGLLDSTKENRTINGVILVDKPPGISSFGVVKRIRKAFKIDRVGHLGTLDPFATGLLPVLIGESTKLFQFLSKLDKRYTGTLELGKKTTTGDPYGNIIKICSLREISKENVESAIYSLIGEFVQNIPYFSAKKINGKPSYKWAREGKPKNPGTKKGIVKQVIIKSIELPYVEFELEVSSGTYVRAWAEKIGEILGVGGMLINLRRISYGNFKIDDAIRLEEIENLALTNWDKIHIISSYDALSHLRTVEISDDNCDLVLNGGIITNLNLAFEPQQNELIKLVDKDKNLLAIIEYKGNEKETYKYKRVFNIWK